MLKKLSIFFIFLFFVSCTTMQIDNELSNLHGLSNDVQKYLYMPSTAKVLMSETVVIGKDDNWVGRIVLITDKEIEKTYSLIREKYSENGWNLKTTYQSENAFLVFEKKSKLITIDVSLSGIVKNRTKITFTLSNM